MLKSQRGVSAAGRPTVLPDFRSSLIGKFPIFFADVNVDGNVDVDVNVDVSVDVNVDIHCISATNCVNVRFNLNALQKSPIFGPFSIQSVWQCLRLLSTNQINHRSSKNCDCPLRAMKKDHY